MTDDPTEPTVSVVVPVYNDPDGIETTLQSLVDQEYPDEDHEIIVVDNGSTDETPDVIESFAERHEPVVSLSESDVQGSYAARNRGVERASGEVIAFIDADMWVDPDWLESIVRVASIEDYDYFGCEVEIVPVNDPPTLVERYNVATGFPVEEYVEESHFAPTCCMVTRATVFEEVGLFDERLVSSGDKEFGDRVYRNGSTQGFVPEITMYHPAREMLSELRRKSIRIGRGRAQLSRYHESRGFEKTSMWHPKQYAPPRPHRFYRRFRQHGFGKTESVRLYWYVYTSILASTWGHIRERFAELDQ